MKTYKATFEFGILYFESNNDDKATDHAFSYEFNKGHLLKLFNISTLELIIDYR